VGAWNNAFHFGENAAEVVVQGWFGDLQDLNSF